MCALSHLLPLVACNYHGWPVPCPKQPALNLRMFHKKDAGAPYTNPHYNQGFRDNMLLNFKEARGTAYGGLSDEKLDEQMLSCSWSGEMGAFSLLVPTRTENEMDYATEVIESTRCLRNTGWPNLLTSCIANITTDVHFNANGPNACRRDKTQTYTPWSTLYNSTDSATSNELESAAAGSDLGK